MTRAFPTSNIETGDLKWLRASEVLTIISVDREIRFVTYSGTYKLLDTIDGFNGLLNRDGFEKIDRWALANIPNATMFDKSRHELEFVNRKGIRFVYEVSRRHAARISARYTDK
ncbi:LytTr DNA-binding domain-containing protein [Paenibacillus cellulosilyticus]|uniref:LytTr DNA-binding domain-containing protein n=1 Tax=Paenibacillus cellulosilyticus TaxID=375489 RepID=A0A2V2YUX7_9BACL|nr:LytTr DNA-binding domain-containing protein [Paenibacillus cellulosilyticus]QKS46869.1 LytTR family transcriptional regulator DNA-binding domain-containing protein [Paenibacillus cellulosilyticus]